MATKEINDFTVKTSLVGTESILIQEAGGTTLRATLDGIHKAKVGFFNYNDLATATTSIAHTGTGGFIKLTNDTLGANTNIAYPPTGVTKLWDSVTNQLDFSELVAGDTVDIRVDFLVTTSGVNQNVTVALDLGIGAGAYSLELDHEYYKTAGTYNVTSYTGIYMGDANTLNNPGEISVDSDAAATIVVNGWYIRAVRR